MTSSALGTLWIVATPLGNPGDLSPRAKEILEGAAHVLAEDTRRAGQLFARCGMKHHGFSSFHDHNEEERLPRVLEALEGGQQVALISDAGTPLLSDPGFRLVRACRERGIVVKPVPGPSAPVTALCASGLPPLPFVFLGFPPRKEGEREAFFAPYASLPATLIFFERKDRLGETLGTAYTLLGERELCVARELTKTYEEFIHLPLSRYAELSDALLGELTILLGPPCPGASRHTEEDVLALIAKEVARGGKPKEVARRVQLQIMGWSAKDVYKLMQGISSVQAS